MMSLDIIVVLVGGIGFAHHAHHTKLKPSDVAIPTTRLISVARKDLIVLVTKNAKASNSVLECKMLCGYSRDVSLQLIDEEVCGTIPDGKQLGLLFLTFVGRQRNSIGIPCA